MANADPSLKLVMAIEANTQQFAKQLDKAMKSIDGLDSSVKNINSTLNILGGTTDKTFSKMEKNVARATGSMTSFANVAKTASQAAVVMFATDKIAQFAKSVTDIGDKWTGVENRLKAVNVESGNVKSVQGEIADIAIKTRSEFAATGELFSRMYQASASLGYSVKDILKLTEGINSAFVSGGSSVQETVAATRQLVQALGSGRLQGDELRSILEGAPLIAQALAKEFGVAVGELKNLGADGMLVTERVLPALIKASGDWGKTLSTQAVSVEQGMTNLGTAVDRFVQYQLGDVFKEIGSAADGAGKSINNYVKEAEKANDPHYKLKKNIEDLAAAQEYLAKNSMNTLDSSIAAHRSTVESLTKVTKKSADEVLNLAAAQSKLKFNEVPQSVIDSLDNYAGALGRAADAAAAMNGKMARQGGENGLDTGSGPAAPNFGSDSKYTPAPLKKSGRGRKSSGGGGSKTDVIADIREEAETYGMLDKELDLYNALKEQGVALSSAKGQAISEEIDKLYQVKAAVDAVRDAEESLQEMGSFVGDEIGSALDSIITKADSAKEAFAKLAGQIAIAVLKAALFNDGPMKGLFGGGGGDSGGGAFGGILGGLAKNMNLPGFATGGSFKVGGTGVGDSQTVAFKANPNETVSITKPGQSMGGGGAVVINQSFDFRNADDSTVGRLQQMAASIKSDSIKAAIEAVRSRNATNPNYLVSA